MPKQIELTAETMDSFAEQLGLDEFPGVAEQPPPVQYSGPQSGKPFDMPGFLSKHGLRVRSTSQTALSTKYTLEECPFDPSHKAPDSYCALMASGAQCFHCSHDSCEGYKWQNLREKLEPGYQNTAGQKQLQQQHSRRADEGQTAPQRIEYQNLMVAKPKLINLATVTPRPVEWFWPGRLAIGKLSVLAGEPGLGKSQLLIDLMARVTTGNNFPDGSFCLAGSAVYLSAEDDIEDTIAPRAIAAGADTKHVTILQGVEYQIDDNTTRSRCFNLERDLPALREAIDALPGCRLVCIDPISSYLGETDSHKNAELRGLLAPLSELAAEKHVAIVANTHLNKTSGAKAMHRVTGSLAFVAAARAAWLVTADKDKPERRLFLPIKNNLARNDGGLAFGIVDINGAPALAWEEGKVTVSADDALSDDKSKDKARDKEQAWLKTQLSEGPLTHAYLKSECEKSGFKWRTVLRAADDLELVKFKSAFRGGWSWKLPEECHEAPSHDEEVSFGVSSF